MVHTAQIDDVMKVLQDGFNDHHQQQQIELNRLQQQLQEQQEQQSALTKVNTADNIDLELNVAVDTTKSLF